MDTTGEGHARAPASAGATKVNAANGVGPPPSEPCRGELARTSTPRRTRYAPPRLERLGEWSALTLQQSVGIGPGDF